MKYKEMKIIIIGKLQGYWDKFIRYYFTHKNDIIDAFFISSLGLVICKIIYFFIFSTNPNFYINYSLLCLFWILQFKFPIILKQFRAYYVKVLKILLGINFWQIDDEYIDQSHSSYVHSMNKYKLKNCSLFNKIIQYIFCKLLQLELFKLAYFKLFFIIHLLLIICLLFNNGFVVIYLITLIFLFSRLNLLLSDWTLDNFFTGISFLDPPIPNSYIEASWDNAFIIALWVTRTFHSYESLENDLKRFPNKIDEFNHNSYSTLILVQLYYGFTHKFLQLSPSVQKTKLLYFGFKLQSIQRENKGASFLPYVLKRKLNPT